MDRMMSAKTQIQSIAETLTSTELFDVLRQAGQRYIDTATNLVEAIRHMADEIDDSTISDPESVADFVEALQHAINGIFLLGNAAVTKLKTAGADKKKIEAATRAISGAATAIAINAIVMSLKK